jgi:hypothetical protein
LNLFDSFNQNRVFGLILRETVSFMPSDENTKLSCNKEAIGWKINIVIL